MCSGRPLSMILLSISDEDCGDSKRALITQQPSIPHQGREGAQPELIMSSRQEHEQVLLAQMPFDFFFFLSTVPKNGSGRVF